MLPLMPMDSLDATREDQAYQAEMGQDRKTLGHIPAGVNQCNSTQASRVVPIQASCRSNSQCVLQVFQLFRAVLCLRFKTPTKINENCVCRTLLLFLFKYLGGAQTAIMSAMY